MLEEVFGIDLSKYDVILIKKPMTIEEQIKIKDALNKNGLDNILILGNMSKDEIELLDEEEMKYYGWVKIKNE